MSENRNFLIARYVKGSPMDFFQYFRYSRLVSVNRIFKNYNF